MVSMLAKNLDASHLGMTVTVPVAGDSSITDVVTDVLHTTRPGVPETWGGTAPREPLTLVRLEHTRPVFDLGVSREGYLGEFFVVDGEATVDVHFPNPGTPEEADHV